MVTRGQLTALGVTTWSTSVTLSKASLKTKRWQSEHLDLAVSARWLLKGVKSREFGLD